MTGRFSASTKFIKAVILELTCAITCTCNADPQDRISKLHTAHAWTMSPQKALKWNSIQLDLQILSFACVEVFLVWKIY
jgi:hypothetical protein